MTRDQLIRNSFEEIAAMPQAIAMLFYGRLFELDPSLRRMFHTDMHVQSRKLMDTLSVVVNSLDRFQELGPSLRDLGRHHALDFAVKPVHYALVIEALLWAFAQALQQDFDPETRKAWNTVLEDVAREMLAGAEKTEIQ